MRRKRQITTKHLPPSLAYLRKFYVPNRTARFTDTRLLTLVIQKLAGARGEPPLEPEVFAEAIQVAEPSTNPLTDNEIKSLDPTIDFTGYNYPKGRSLQEQIASVLPQNPSILPVDGDLRQALIHLLTHLVRGFPGKFAPGEFHAGLDYLSSAMFTLNHIARISGTPVKWPEELYKIDGLKIQTPDWQNLTIRPDGAPRIEWSWLTSRLRNRIRSLRYEPLRAILAKLNSEKKPSMIRRQDIEGVAGVPRTAARFVQENLKQLITERHLISMPSIGLRHRCVISHDKRQPWPMHSLYEYVALDDEDFGSLQFYIEPVTSEGPDNPNLLSIAAHTEVVSFRMSLFNPFSKQGEELGIWRDMAFEDAKFNPEGENSWPYAESETASNDSVHTPSEIERMVLSILWTHRGPPEHRSMLPRIFDIPTTTWRENLARIRNASALSVVYHPSLEYCALPDGVYLAVMDASISQIEDVNRWLCTSFPYAHILLGDDGLVALVRLPEGKSAYYSSVMESEMMKRNLQYIFAHPKAQRTYYMTALSRLFSMPEGKWKDPWVSSLR